jgi:hypothetical protein
MTRFKAWALPSRFSPPTPDEIVAAGVEVGRTPLDGGGGEIQYLKLGEERLNDLVRILRSSRWEELLSFPVERVLTAVDGVAGRFLDSSDPLRGRALAGLEQQAGYSASMAAAVLDGMARDWRADRLREMLCSEFHDPAVLDGFQPAWAGGLERALGYPLAFHLGAGTVPGVAVTSLIRSLLVKSAVILKPGRGDVTLPVLFATGLAEEDAELAESVAVVFWPGPFGDQTEWLLGRVDLVVAYGSDDTVAWVRDRLPVHTPLRAYRHRLGVGLVGRGALGGGEEGEASRTAAHAARAVAVFDQRGCVSPHVLFVERGGEVDPEDWTRRLAGALKRMEEVLPSGRVPAEEGAALQQLRGAAELEEGAGRGVIHHGGRDAPWTVLLPSEARLVPSCLNRTVRVLPVDDLMDVAAELESWVPHLQTVGVAGWAHRELELREALARLGVSRIVDLAQVPWPPPWWHHDGSGPLQSLVRWTDAEEVS